MTGDEAREAILRVLRRAALMDRHPPRMTPLAGGVSSDIWRVDLGARRVCVKRALPKLKVAADWRAPVERNAFEAGWMRIAAAVEPDAVPELLFQDPDEGALVMAYLPPDEYPVWKEQLRDGRVDPEVAHAVGRRLVRIHAATARDPALAREFATDAIFHAIRLEPYLLATARAHPDRADALEGLAATTAATRLALVHGDVSPKNILIGPKGPVFLDAECAWYGDPAFDVAFCLNHLLLKCLWVPKATGRLLEAYDALARAYLSGVAWEPAETLEARAARLLPGLLLARIDGKSPVEYLTSGKEKADVRAFAIHHLTQPLARLEALREAWFDGLG
jgi:aminoglycoside phosphotransferase (APT) family kinase protein